MGKATNVDQEEESTFQQCMKIVEKAISGNPIAILVGLKEVHCLVWAKITEIANEDIKKLSKAVKQELLDNLKEELEFLKSLDTYIVNERERCSRSSHFPYVNMSNEFIIKKKIHI